MYKRQILLRAELKAKTGDTDCAIRDLNRVRNRAGVRDYSLADGDLQDVIADERDRELFCEGISTRYFDIMRNGTFREKLRGNFKTCLLYTSVWFHGGDLRTFAPVDICLLREHF